MATNPESIDRLTNALQSALMLAAGLQRDLQQAARDAAQLVEAVSKAASAAHELRRTRASEADTSRVAKAGERPPHQPPVRSRWRPSRMSEP